MRIALVHSFYSAAEPSGENTQVVAEAEALADAGLDVEIFARRTDEVSRQAFYRARSVGRVALGAGASPRDAIERFVPDVVHVHNLFPNFGRRWVRTIRAPVVATIHNFRFVCANGLLFREGAPCLLCTQGSVWPAVRHSCYRDSRLGSAAVAVGIRGGGASDALLQRADRILCLSQRQLALLHASGIPRSRLAIGRNFLPAALDPGDQRSRGGVRDSWLVAGRLTPEKGVLSLAQNWPRDAPPLRIAGVGPEAERIAAIADARQITFLGSLTRPQVLGELTRAIGLVLPSLWFEGAPLVVLEALASGARILVTGNSDLHQLADDSGAITVGSPAAAAGLRPIPDAARSLFDAQFSQSAVVTDRVQLYTDLVAEQASAERR